jgi:AraC-like DNA-binding protein
MARVGFSDPSHFTRDFTRRHGASPCAIRASAHAPQVETMPAWMSSTIGQETVESAHDRAIHGAVAPLMIDGSARNIA